MCMQIGFQLGMQYKKYTAFNWSLLERLIFMILVMKTVQEYFLRFSSHGCIVLQNCDSEHQT